MIQSAVKARVSRQMSTEPPTPGTRLKGNRLFIWCIVTLVTTTLLTGIAVFVFLQRQKIQRGPASATSMAAENRLHKRSAKSFAELSEIDIPGRYKWSDGNKISHITLNQDHTFIGQDGVPHKNHRWELLPDRLVIFWISSVSQFTNFEAPGVYSYMRPEGILARLEKQPTLSLATFSISPTDVVASVSFGANGQTNGLTPANTGGDGKFALGNMDGQECGHVIRRRDRPIAYLYLRLGDEIRTQPISNAVVLVEYFDAAPIDATDNWLYVQYDATDGPYTGSVNRAQLTGSLTWTQAIFFLDVPLFQKRQNDEADFRLAVRNTRLHVRGIKLVTNKTIP